jgi:hypothetical protein
VSLAPYAGIGNIAKRSEINPRDELATRTRQNHDLVVTILRDAIKGFDEFGVIGALKVNGPPLV